MESVSKGLRLPGAIRTLLAEVFPITAALQETPRLMPFTPLAEMEKALQRRIDALVGEAFDRLRGRV